MIVEAFAGKRVLALSPHPDDIELGAAGFLQRLLAVEAEVSVLRFTDCRSVAVGDRIGTRYSEGVLGREARDASDALGIRHNDWADFYVRSFRERRAELLQRLYDMPRPDLVICPSSYDLHQDHQVVHEEALRAFRGATMLGYECPWASRGFQPSLWVSLKLEHVNGKLGALMCYESQHDRPYFAPDFLRGWMRMRGVESGRGPFAEAFEVIRAVS